MEIPKAAVPDYFSSCSSLYLQLDRARLPQHIAIIMDGNSRWARARGLLGVRGHEHARESVRQCVRACGELGAQVLSLFAFSTENWKRPKEEVHLLLNLFKITLEQEKEELDKNNVRLRITGDRSALPEGLNQVIEETIKALQDNSGLILNLAINYGGQQDILQAVNRLKTMEEKISEENFERLLYTSGLPRVDLMIRTSGELRISNFFLWQAAYAELYFTPVLWPDFRRQHLLEAIVDYQKRDRRFGIRGSAMTQAQ